MSSPDSSPAPWAKLPRLVKIDVLALGVFTVLLSLLLWPAWRHNPDVSHGLLMPAVFLLLLHQSRSAGPRRYLRAGRGEVFATVALALAGLGLLFVGGLYAAAVDWSNALVDFLLAGAYALLLGAALVVLAGERLRWIPFNWTAGAVVALWPLSAPIPPGTYTRLTLGLQLWISTGVLHTLRLLGVIAFRQGNVIQLATTAVGIEEACSGVRSLVSCVFVGLFLSAIMVSRPRDRALIIALAAPLALGMNFIRSLTLTLLANSGVAIEGAWHDATGFAVLGATAVLLGGLAIWLSRRENVSVRPRSIDVADRPRTVAPAIPALILTVALALAAALVAFFYANTRPSVRRQAVVPDLLALLPESAPGWSTATTPDLYRFRDVLQTDFLAQRSYRSTRADGPVQIVLYLAYWRPGQAPVSLVATHTPDACWPGTGWISQPAFESREALITDGRVLPDAESRLFISSSRYPRYVWFWHLYDGHPLPYISPYSLGRLLRIAWLYGFRHDGDQVFIRVSSNRPWSEISREPFLQQFFSHLQPLGLGAPR